jgi:hypothetical protein
MHTAKYERNPHEALYRVTCTCGWCRVAASLEECEAAFTGHDLWQPVEAWKARLREIGRVK